MEKRAHRKTWLIPYLTLDNLCNEKSNLLQLLHGRSSAEPEAWALFDSQQMDDAFENGSLELMFHSCCITMHDAGYGFQTDWTREAAHAWDIVGWPRAQLILEAQAELMKFLLTVVDLLLKGYGGRGGSENWQKLTNARSKMVGSQEVWATYTRQAFSTAPEFEPHELLEIAAAKWASGEDELWLLQTDPGYTALQIGALRKLDWYREIKKSATAGEHFLWACISKGLFEQALSRAQFWRWVAQELAFLCELCDIHSKQIHTGHPLPLQYAQVHGALQTLLTNEISQMVNILKNNLSKLPGFQDHYECGNIAGILHQRMKTLRGRHGTDAAWFNKDPLFWAILQITEQQTTGMNLMRTKFFHLAFIDQHLVRADATERARMDQRTYHYLADMAGMDSILTALRMLDGYHRSRSSLATWPARRWTEDVVELPDSHTGSG